MCSLVTGSHPSAWCLPRWSVSHRLGQFLSSPGWLIVMTHACMRVEHVLLFPSSTDGPLSCFYLLFVVNSTAVHAGDVSAPAPALRTKPQSGDARAGGNSVFSPFGELPCCFPQQHNLLPSHPQCTRAPSLATILSACEPEGIALVLKMDLMKRV